MDADFRDKNEYDISELQCVSIHLCDYTNSDKGSSVTCRNTMNYTGECHPLCCPQISLALRRIVRVSITGKSYENA